jgi:HPt (histidine-containing phosphotransfer) domain-containing protein
MDGLEATRTLRSDKDERLRSVPVIAMTAHAMKGDHERCLEAGMDGYLTKPISGDRLIEEMGRVLAPTLKRRSGESTEDTTCATDDQEEEDVPPLDQERLLQHCMGKPAICQRILTIFRDTVPGTLEELKQGLAEGNIEEAARLAHSLKGAAANVVAHSLQGAAFQVEQAAKSGNSRSARLGLEALTRETNRCLRFVTTLLAESDTAPEQTT